MRFQKSSKFSKNLTSIKNKKNFVWKMSKYRNMFFYDFKSCFLIIFSSNHRHRLVLKISFPGHFFSKNIEIPYWKTSFPVHRQILHPPNQLIDSVICQDEFVLNLFRMGVFGAAQGWGDKKAPLPKICHTYPRIMKLGTVITCLKKIQKLLNHATHSLSSADISIFYPEISKFFYMQKCRYRSHIDT